MKAFYGQVIALLLLCYIAALREIEFSRKVAKTQRSVFTLNRLAIL